MKLKVLQEVGNGFLSLSLSHECQTNMGVILVLMLPSVQNLHQDVSYKAHIILRVPRGKSQVALLLMYKIFRLELCIAEHILFITLVPPTIQSVESL